MPDEETLKHQDILDLAVERFRVGMDADKVERESADFDKKFAIDYEGCQWDSEIRSMRDAANRTTLTVNKIPEKLDVAMGEYHQLKASVKVRPVDSAGDPAVADIIAGLHRHIEQVSMAEVSYDTAKSDQITCGRGAWRVNVVDCEEDPFVKELRIGRIPNVLSLIFDPDAKEVDKSDGKWWFIVDFVPEKEFKHQYPGVGAMDWPSSDTAWEGWRTDVGVRVAEYWWKQPKKVKYHRIEHIDPETGLEKVYTAKADAEIPPGATVIDKKTVEEHQIMWCLMVANKIIDGPHKWPGKYFSIIWVSGKETNISGKPCSRGMIRFAITPQQMYNFWSSASAEHIALAPKAPVFMPDDCLGPYQAIWDNAHVENRPYLPYKVPQHNTQLKPYREAPPAMSTAYAGELQNQDHNIMSAMGRYNPSLGSEVTERSGVAIGKLQRQGSIGAAPFDKRMEYSLKHGMRVVVDMIPHVYDTERVLRILDDEDNEQRVPVNLNRQNHPMRAEASPDPDGKYWKQGINEIFNDLTVGKYDIAMTMGPSYATLREEILAQLVELVKVAPMLAGVVAEMIVETMDIPRAHKLLQKVRDIMPKPQEGPSLDEMKFQLEIEKLKQGMHELLRKDQEMFIDNVTKVMKAESLERGEQFTEAMGKVQRGLDAMKIGLEQQELAQQAPTGGPGMGQPVQ